MASSNGLYQCRIYVLVVALKLLKAIWGWKRIKKKKNLAAGLSLYNTSYYDQQVFFFFETINKLCAHGIFC